jgi:HK97 family phage major capsid protein
MPENEKNDGVAGLAQEVKNTIVTDIKTELNAVKDSLITDVKNELNGVKQTITDNIAESNKGISAIASLYNQTANTDNRKIQGFKSYRDAEIFGTFVKGLVNLEARPQVEQELERLTGVKTHYAANNRDGGYLVPTQVSYVIIDLLEKFGDYTKLGQRVTMTSDLVEYPNLLSRFTGYWIGEGQAPTESQMTMGQIELHAKDLGAYAQFSQKLLNDSAVNIAQLAVQLFADALAEKIDDAVVNGDGTNGYGGFTGLLPALKAVDGTISNIKGLKVATGNAWSEITLDDLRGVKALLRGDFRSGARWFMSQQFYDTVVEPKILAAGGTTPDNIQNGAALKLLGYPIEIIKKMPTTEANSQVCCLFGDLNRAAYFGSKENLMIASTNVHSTNFLSKINTYLASMSVGYKVFGQGNTTNAGSYVGLITAAS